MAASSKALAPSALHHRLLNDIAEIQRDPYPNPLHLFIEFSYDYPLRAPTVTIQMGPCSNICASILNTTKGWTPAYTLKGVLIQILSFFSSNSLEQEGGDSVDLVEYRRIQPGRRHARHGDHASYEYFCDVCGFSPDWTSPPTTDAFPKTLKTPAATVSKLLSLPDEVVLLMLEDMPTRDVLALADAVPFVQQTVHSYDFIHTRELQCFCLKKSYLDAKLGIGISITGASKPFLRSEFDLLSQEAFFQHDVRRSVQGIEFDKWLPLPLSRRHWKAVKTNALACLRSIHSHAKMRSNQLEDVDVLYYLMNNVVVQFSADAEKDLRRTDERSTISHASEKAVEAYFPCFHLLLCLATENSAIVTAGNKMVKHFLAGPRAKKQFPDLGHLLVAALVSDDGLTQALTLHIIKESVLRNVVWMLDSKGADMAELAYLEPSVISEYRLVKTFEASRTSYRLLMSLKFFSSSARSPGKSLANIREALFESHDIPSKKQFTSFLRRTITDSVAAGYSIMPLSQSKLYMIRKVRERDVEVANGVVVTEALVAWYKKGEEWYWNGWKGRQTFFPGRKESADGPR
ncbi:hypothetical protein EJ07DRAFT_169658 [Lizonia empirigonia]|nr:hypothetical protein EJ07DRAFT_169658 [Lizonia empirigonia]